MSEALMVKPPPSTVVMVGGTVSEVVTSPQLAVNVNVGPLVVPVQTAVMSPPGMGAATAIGANATNTTIEAAASNPTPLPTTARRPAMPSRPHCPAVPRVDIGPT